MAETASGKEIDIHQRNMEQIWIERMLQRRNKKGIRCNRRASRPCPTLLTGSAADARARRPLWLLAAWLLWLALVPLQRIRRLKLAHQKQGVVTSLSQGLERQGSAVSSFIAAMADVVCRRSGGDAPDKLRQAATSPHFRLAAYARRPAMPRDGGASVVPRSVDGSCARSVQGGIRGGEIWWDVGNELERSVWG